jgi:uncharacterized membrane protein YvlD (DUF360 family)
MNYLKSLFINFLTIFFSNHILPGLSVTSQRLPLVGSDLIFAAALGFLNSLIHPLLKLLRQDVTVLRIALISIILNFTTYGIVRIVSIGVEVHSVEGYILASSIVTLGSFFSNYFEMKRSRLSYPENM